jgi:uncharacterized protein (DUF2062 family)
MFGFRERLKKALSVSEAPHLVAISFAIGVFFGVSPLLGLHTILGLAAAWIFRLNKLVVLSGVYVTNPWSIIPIYTFCTWTGAQMLGIEEILPNVNWHTVTMQSLLGEFKHVLLPFAVGSTVVAVFASIVSYFLVRRAVERFRSVSEELEG